MKTDLPSEICDKIVDLFSATMRHGAEMGLRGMAKKCHAEATILHEMIRKMDKEFDHVCPCTSFKDGLCERCGATDVFSIARKFSACTSPKPTSG